MKRPHLSQVSFTCLFLAFTALGSTAAEELTLDEAGVMALVSEKNAALALQKIDTEAKERVAKNSLSNFLTLDGSASLGGGYSKSLYKTGSTGLSTEIAVSSALTLSAAALQATKTAGYDAEAARISYIKTKDAELMSARKTFYNILLLQAKQAAALYASKAAEEALADIKEKHKYGLSSELTLRQAEVTAINKGIALQKTGANVANAESSFIQTLGLPEGTTLTIKGTLDFKTSAVVLPDRVDYDALPSIALLLAQQRVKASTVEENRLTRNVPSLKVAASAGIGVSDLVDAFNDFEGVFDHGESLTITISSPSLKAFLPFSTTSLSAASDEDALRKNAIQIAEARASAMMAVDQLVKTLELSSATIQSLSVSFDLAQKVLDLAKEAYQAGTSDYSTVRDAIEDLDSARLALLTERYAYISSLIDLEYATGKSFSPRAE